MGILRLLLPTTLHVRFMLGQGHLQLDDGTLEFLDFGGIVPEDLVRCCHEGMVRHLLLLEPRKLLGLASLVLFKLPDPLGHLGVIAHPVVLTVGTMGTLSFSSRPVSACSRALRHWATSC